MNILNILSIPRIEVYIVPPHKFLVEYQQQLLPDWKIAVASVILVLQQTTVSLKKDNESTKLEKERCRDRFIHWGCQLIATLRQQGNHGELFDPATGYPWLTHRGMLAFDDNAAVSTLLHFPLDNYQNCSLIQHPIWKNNIYPGTIVSSAPPKIAESWCEKQLDYWYQR